MLNRWIKKIKTKFKRGMEQNDIDQQQLIQMQKQGATIIDVRSPQEYKESHLEGAICIPEYDIQKHVTQIIPNKEEIIVLYCDSR